MKKLSIFILLEISIFCLCHAYSEGSKTMIYKTDIYSIEYDKKSEPIVKTINDALSQNFQRVMDFWGIKKLDSTVQIRIFSDLEEWKSFFKSLSQGTYQEYVTGCAIGSNIYVLDYAEYKKLQSHRNDSIEDFKKIIVHEFVHICHLQLCKLENTAFFMSEGLAAYLAGQGYNQNIKTDYPKEVLFSNEIFSRTNDLYSLAQKIVRKLEEKVPHEKLIEYALDSKKLYDDWDSLALSN